VKSRGSQCNETLLVRAAVRPGKKLGLQSAAKKTCSDGDARTDSGRLFQTDAAAAGMGDCLRTGKPSRYITNQLGQLSRPSLWGR